MEVGNVLREKDGTSRADRTTNGAVVVNGPRHQRCQRRDVRAATPVAGSAARALAATQRDRAHDNHDGSLDVHAAGRENRTDGGVAR